MIRFFSLYAVPLVLVGIPLYGLCKKQPVYELFVEGAAEGLRMALQIFPYLLAMLVSISVFRASGAFSAISAVLAPVTDAVGIPADVLPLALMRPLSGSGALALSTDILKTHGPDSFTGFLASVMQGSTDTTFYILAVYFGSVGVKKYRYALTVGLSADMVSFLCSFIASKLLFPL